MPGLSNAPFLTPFRPQVQTLPSINPGTLPNVQTTNPATVGAAGGTPSGGTLRYPADTPKYYMAFSISKYNRTDLNSIGQFVDAGYPGIILPLPSQLVDGLHVNWHEVEVGTLPGMFVQGLANLAHNQTGQAGLNSLLTAGAGLAGSIAGTFGSLAGAVVPGIGNAVSGGEAILGFSPNQFLTLLMRGPTYKRHKFTWEFAPQNYEEANNLNNIINTFKNAMSPNIYQALAGAPVLWSFPKIFRIGLYPNSKFMYKFKPCICDFFIANMAPTGRASFKRNGTGTTGDNPPSIVQIQMNLIELEFWIEGQFTGGNVTTGTPDNDPTNVEAIAPNP